MDATVEKNDEIVMKLLHYFITQQNYSPIVLQGAQNEIWLEKLEGDYKIVRIVSNYIHNNEQFTFDLYRTEQIMKRIKKKTMTLHLNALSIFVNLGENVNMQEFDINHIDCVEIKEIEDLKKYPTVIEIFPNITQKMKFKEKGMELFIKLTNDITKKSESDARMAEDIFEKKKPVVTYALIAINILVFILMYLLGNGSKDVETLVQFGASYTPYIQGGEYFRLIASAFLHIGIFHLLFNMYALYIIGPQIENFFGKIKFLIIYLFSAITGNLLSMLFVTDAVSAGASGAIFGILGALVYFGYHYRVYLGNVMKSQIIPLILLNLLIGFVTPGIGSSAHIGGLIGGFLIAMALGVKYKSTKTDKINGWIMSTIFTAFLIYFAFFR